MRILTTVLAIAAVAAGVIAGSAGESRSASELQAFQSESHKAVPISLQANSLCGKTERIIFSCRVKPAAKRSRSGPLKIASLCASTDLDKDHGYLQYRFGLPGKLELEFPNSRTGTQQMFQYTHYMRYQVDLTEINFHIDDYEYQIFDTYNGEEKPPIAERGVNVMVAGKPKGATFVCFKNAKGDYSTLEDALPRAQD